MANRPKPVSTGKDIQPDQRSFGNGSQMGSKVSGASISAGLFHWAPLSKIQPALIRKQPQAVRDNLSQAAANRLVAK